MGEELPEKLLVLLDGLSVVDSQTLSQKFGQDHQRIVGAIKSLEALGQYNQWYNKYITHTLCILQCYHVRKCQTWINFNKNVVILYNFKGNI